MRKIIQICTMPEGEGTRAAMFALCDDGALYMLLPTRGVSGDNWARWPNVPQDDGPDQNTKESK